MNGATSAGWTRVLGLCGLWATLGCAHPGGAEPSALASIADRTQAPGTGSADEPDTDAGLAREIQLHMLRLEHRDPAERSRARMDLADAYVRRAGRAAMARFELDERSSSATEPERAAIARQHTELQAQRDQWLAKAAAAYETVLESSDSAAIERHTEARFGLADVRSQQGDPVAAHELLLSLVHEDPEHALVSPALLMLGDEAFAEQRLQEAQALYERVVQSGASRHQAYARYKLGWIAINLDHAQVALEHWTWVVTESRSHPDRAELGKAAAKDCVLAYARVGRPEVAAAFFSRLYPERSHDLLQRLAQRYLDDGRPDAAAIVQGRPPVDPAGARPQIRPPSPRI